MKNLELIKQHIQDGTYCILPKAQWDKFAGDLCNSGNNLLKEIEEIRNEARKMKINFYTLKYRLDTVTDKFEEVATKFDLFFDSGMRWLRCAIERNQYEEYQILYKKHIERLLEHCRQSMNYLANIISSRRDECRFFRLLILSIVTVTIVLISLILDFFQFFGNIVK